MRQAEVAVGSSLKPIRCCHKPVSSKGSPPPGMSSPFLQPHSAFGFACLLFLSTSVVVLSEHLRSAPCFGKLSGCSHLLASDWSDFCTEERPHLAHVRNSNTVRKLGYPCVRPSAMTGLPGASLAPIPHTYAAPPEHFPAAPSKSTPVGSCSKFVQLTREAGSCT